MPPLRGVPLVAPNQPELERSPGDLEAEVGLAVPEEGGVGTVVPAVLSVTAHCKGWELIVW